MKTFEEPPKSAEELVEFVKITEPHCPVVYSGGFAELVKDLGKDGIEPTDYCSVYTKELLSKKDFKDVLWRVLNYCRSRVSTKRLVAMKAFQNESYAQAMA